MDIAFERFRARARELADTGQYHDAAEVAEALADEGWKNPMRLFSKDMLWELVELRCADARKRLRDGPG